MSGEWSEGVEDKIYDFTDLLEKEKDEYSEILSEILINIHTLMATYSYWKSGDHGHEDFNVLFFKHLQELKKSIIEMEGVKQNYGNSSL